MNCKNFGCRKQADGRFPCCSITCGCKFKADLEDYKSYARDLMPLQNWYFGHGPGEWPIEKMAYFYKLFGF